MDESSKTMKIRGPQFAQTYLSGRVIDIGCGRDPVCSWAEPFDLEHGDASQIATLRPHDHYDAVHSSHCLEHMPDPVKALEQWWQLVRPGGFLIIVVPDEDLYEQGFWPSRFNTDHKATFRLGGHSSWSPVSHDLEQLVRSLPGAHILEATRQDHGYDHALRSQPDARQTHRTWFPHRLIRKILRAVAKPLGRKRREVMTRQFDDYCFHHYGIPVDQTAREAVAQIQVIATKVPADIN